MNTFALAHILTYFAAAGGGGSSSGGDGSGFIGAISYFIMYYVAKLFKKLLPRPAAMTVTIIIAITFSLLIFIVTIASHSGFGWYIGISLIAGVWIGWSAQMFSFWDKARKRLKKADADLAKAGWDEAKLQQLASQTFMRYQHDWSVRDSSHFAEYMTPHYAAHATLMVQALAELHRYDVMNELQIIKIDTSAVVDSSDDSQDYFSVFIEAKARDVLMDETQKQLFVNKKPFIEEWTFQRSDNTWLLANIRQTTEAPQFREQDMQQFAEQNNLFYSLDMGWLFIPARGELFNNGKYSFGYSDINNHIIGLWGKNLVQIYTYVRAENQSNQNGKSFLVGQIHVPKEYGGILIERKKGIFKRLFAPKGYQKYEFEWPDFNKRYQVYATDRSRLATFELLNPGFMAFLFDNFNDINIEVIDNIIYFYAQKVSARSDYEKLLELLTKAHKELRM